MSELTVAVDRLIDWLAETTLDANGLLVPVSGGSDGALTLWLCQQAFPARTRGIYFGTDLRHHEWFESVTTIYVEAEPPAWIEAEAYRWSRIHTLCVTERYWPTGSRNRTETVLGTYSRPSLIATCLPLAAVWKSDVLRLCGHLGFPEAIRDSSRLPDPVCGRPQTISDIGIERIDNYLKLKMGIAGGESLQEDEARLVESILQVGLLKAQLPHYGPEVF